MGGGRGDVAFARSICISSSGPHSFCRGSLSHGRGGSRSSLTDAHPRECHSVRQARSEGRAKEYPNKPGHVLLNDADAKTPRALHPAFYGCYDWHSAVHGHWMLAHLLRKFPDLPEAKEIRDVLNSHLTAENVRGEVEYFNRKEAKSFERPYGWTWLLKLAEELHGWDDADAKKWSAAVRPLAELIAGRYIEHFPKQTYPIRSGVHPNTAFGFAFALDYARAVGDRKLEALIVERAKSYYAKDVDAPARWEPDGSDFLSPSLCEADLMRRVLPPAEFRTWFQRYLPGAAKGEPKNLFEPATVTDRSDPQLVHLDGLNLSRAWCMRGIASSLAADDPRAGPWQTRREARRDGTPARRQRRIRRRALAGVVCGVHAGDARAVKSARSWQGRGKCRKVLFQRHFWTGQLR